MFRSKCAECGKQLPPKGCWWRYHYDEIEILCPKCAKSAMDFRFPSNLLCVDIVPPPIRGAT